MEQSSTAAIALEFFVASVFHAASVTAGILTLAAF